MIFIGKLVIDTMDKFEKQQAKSSSPIYFIFKDSGFITQKLHQVQLPHRQLTSIETNSIWATSIFYR